ncbi:MAG: UDP-glucose 4-epimerase GalE [Gallionella sp.]|jgi:UDP-glucose 4-epimerase
MILVTGGMGYIGSHTCVVLAEAGYQTLILDNLANSHLEVLDRLEQISGVRSQFVNGDVRDAQLLDELFLKHNITAVIHFAGLKAVGESLEIPFEYYDNNVTGSLTLLGAMKRAQVKNFIFSSTANVYGNFAEVPVAEEAALEPNNPYGRSKLMIEQILADLHLADSEWNIACLRYFNPVGAHESGLIGENPQGTPSNLMPIIASVAAGRREKLQVFGDDYPTPDGTGMRDFIHVMDLAEGHLAALTHCLTQGGTVTVNLGTGQGYTVMQMINAFREASEKSIPCDIVARRTGDIVKSWANPAKAKVVLGWQAKRGLMQMCVDTWRWTHHNQQR